MGVAYGHAHHAHPVEDAGEGTPDPPTEFRPDRSTHLAGHVLRTDRQTDRQTHTSFYILDLVILNHVEHISLISVQYLRRP